MTVYYPIGDTVCRAEALVTGSGFSKVPDTEKVIAKLESSDAAYKHCEQLLGKSSPISRQLS